MRSASSLRHLMLVVCVSAAGLAGLGANVQDRTEQFEARMREGEAMLAREQWQDALRTFREANSLHEEKSARAQIGMARAYLGLQEFKRAADRCTQALKYAGGDPALEARARNNRGIALFNMAGKPRDKRLAQAVEDFRAVLALPDTLPIARYNLGVALMKQGLDDEGSAELQKFIEDNPGALEGASAKRFIEMPRRARERFAPDFSIRTLDGEQIELDDLRGKVVLLDFWATWCAPCVHATPGLARMQKRFKDEPFVVIGISADRDRDAWRRFIEKHDLGWPQYFDDRRTMANQFGVSGYPTYVLLDHEGAVRYTKTGWGSGVDAQIEREVRKLLEGLSREPR